MSDWSDIRWFHAVLTHGSFSAAARATGTTQATISRRIKALEMELGGSLFTR
ncbi:MAG: LysR family transcriptional regulator, partial [Pseudomonadota bacterium]